MSDVRSPRHAQVETKTGRSPLGASEALKVDRRARPAPKVALPGCRRCWRPHQAEVAYPDPAQATTLFVWKPVPNAASYHLMLDYSPYFNRPLVDRAGIKENSVELRGLDTGKYYWRVAAVDKDGVEGRSRTSRASRHPPRAGPPEAGPPPLLAISTARRAHEHPAGEGPHRAGATVTVNGQRVDVQSDGTFNEFITLEKPGKQTVMIRAIGLNGGVRGAALRVVVSF